MSGKCDPESQALWNELRRQSRQGAACCGLLMWAIKNGLRSATIYHKDGTVLGDVDVNYCPHCGRKLQ